MIALAETPSAMLNQSGNCGHVFLIPDLEEKLLVFPHRVSVSCGLAVYGHYYVLCLVCSKCLSRKSVEFCQMTSLHVLR